MSKRTHKIIYLAVIPLMAVAVVSGLHQNGVYQRISLLLLTTSSMEAAANGGAIGETLPE